MSLGQSVSPPPSIISELGKRAGRFIDGYLDVLKFFVGRPVAHAVRFCSNLAQWALECLNRTGEGVTHDQAVVRLCRGDWRQCAEQSLSGR